MNILHLDSSARITNSDSRKLGNRLVKKLSQNLDNQICYRDLNNGLHLLSEAHLTAYYTKPKNHTNTQKTLVKTSNTLAAELINCDILIITLPMYNNNIPASLKMWQDLVMREGLTFKTTKTGVKGLLKNKQAYIIITTGGIAHNASNNFLERLMSLFLNTIGITQQTYIHADNIAYDGQKSRLRAQQQIDSLNSAG